MTTHRTAHCFSPMIRRQVNITALLDVARVQWHTPLLSPFARIAAEDCFVGWGYKLDAHLARYHAQRRGLPFYYLEDGFLRSVGLGVQGAPALSIVIDDLGLYYDATRPSRLEAMLNGIPGDLPMCSRCPQPASPVTDPLDDPAILARATSGMRELVHRQLSKYNDAPPLDLGPAGRERVLVVDQTAGDLSIGYGLADGNSFSRMLECALDENPHAEIVVKVHPDVIAGRKKGNLPQADRYRRVRLLGAPANPIALCQQVSRVYVVTSQLGFEALLANRPVTCFGAPFYSGWGLTRDHQVVVRRTRQRTLEQLFAAAYLLYARYQLPGQHDGSARFEDVCRHIAARTSGGAGR